MCRRFGHRLCALARDDRDVGSDERGPHVATTTLVRKKPASFKFPALRFRAKVTLGFAAVLAISALSMVLAYVGFERISAGVVSAIAPALRSPVWPAISTAN